MLTALPDNCLELRATVPNTREVQWWLLGLGNEVEVLAAASLREEMRSMTGRMAARCADPTATR